MHYRLFFVPLVASSLLLSACSSSKPEPEAAELIPKGHSNAVQGSADDIFHTAKHLYYSGLYSVARENFETLRDGYAPGPYAEFGAVKAADAAFEGGEYEPAAQAYEEFITSYSSSRSKPYVMLRLGRSYQLAQKGLGRDPAALEKARDAYQKLIDDYPDSSYAEAARRYRVEVVEALGQYEKLVTDFYKAAYKEPAAEARNAVYEEKWVPLIDKASTEAASAAAPGPIVLAGLSLNQRSFPILAAQRIGTGSARARIGPALIGGSSAGGGTYLQDVSCSGSIVTMKLSGPAPAGLDGQLLPASPAGVKVALANLGTEPLTQNCFATSDLQIDPKGNLRLATTRAARLLTVDNPSRLLLVLQ